MYTTITITTIRIITIITIIVINQLHHIIIVIGTQDYYSSRLLVSNRLISKDPQSRFQLIVNLWKVFLIIIADVARFHVCEKWNVSKQFWDHLASSVTYQRQTTNNKTQFDNQEARQI